MTLRFIVFPVHENATSMHAQFAKLRTTSLGVVPPISVDSVRRIAIDTVCNMFGDMVEEPYQAIVIIHFMRPAIVVELQLASKYSTSFAEHATGSLLGAIVMTVNGGARGV